jgi:hypothetical protein
LKTAGLECKVRIPKDCIKHAFVHDRGDGGASFTVKLALNKEPNELKGQLGKEMMYDLFWFTQEFKGTMESVIDFLEKNGGPVKRQD